MAFFGLGEAEKPPADSSASVDAGKAKSLAQVNGEVKSKHGGARAGAGRKAGAGKGVPPPLGQTNAGTEGDNQAPPSEADIEFIRTSALAALKILDRVESNIIVGTINSIGDKFLTERADAFLKQREIGPADMELVSNAAAAIGAKYSALSRFAPEGALILWAVTHGMAFSNVLGSLKQIAAEVVKARGVQNADRPPPV